MRPDRPPDELTPEEIAFLNRIIRLSRNDGEESPLPEDSLLARYLKGEASAEEVRRVRETLCRSRDLREEMLYLLGLFSRGVQARFDRTAAPRDGARVDARAGDPGARDPGAAGDRDRGSARVEAPLPVRRRERLWRLGLVWGGLVGLAAIVAVVLTLPSRTPVLSWSEGTALVPDQFRVDVLRGGGRELPEPRNMSQAATVAFLEAAEWDGSEFRLHPGEAPAFTGRRISLEIAGAGRPVTAVLPADAVDPEAWFLSLPSLRVHHAPLGRDRVRLTWPGGDSRALITVSYGQASGFGATPAQEIARP